MKNLGRIFTVCMVLCLMLGVAVFAADEELVGIDTVNIFEGVEASAYDYETGDYNFALDYEDAQAGGMYLVLVLANPDEKEPEDIKPTNGNILYVNQITSEGETVTFEKVYPSEIADSYVYMAGTNLSLTALGEITPFVEVADDVTVIAIGKNENIPAYTVDGHNVTVTYSLPCKVGYENADGTYTAITATDNGDGSYDYVVPEDIDEVIVVVKGDANSDGVVTLADSTRTKAVVNKKTSFVSDYAEFAANVNTDNEVTLADSTRTKAVVNKKTSFTW